MPKRKKKKATLDARGYSTTSNNKATIVQISKPSVQQLLDELVVLLDIQKPRPTISVNYKQHHRRMAGGLYDTLVIQYGFSMEQLTRTIQNIGLTSVETTLDYLCLWEPTSQLPPRFTEGTIRDAEQSSTTTSNTLTVLPAIATTITIDRPVHDSLVAQPPKMGRTKKDDDNNNNEQQQHQQHKEWLLSRYQYESEEEEANAAPDGHENNKATLESSHTESHTDATPDVNNNDEKDNHPMSILRQTSTTTTDNQLQTLQTELSQLEWENTDANNYMRSKAEIKSLQNRIKIVRQQVKGLERKLQKQQQQKAVDEESAQKQNDEEEEEEAAPFDIFGASAPEPQAPLEPEEQPPSLVLPKDTVPKSWTGQTPRQVLEKYCQSKKLPKPVYKKIDQKNGCLVRIKQHEVTVKGSIADYRDAQQYASVLILYQLDPTVQLYRLFPVFYRDLWLTWQRQAQSKQNALDLAADRERQEMIDRLVACLPTAAVETVTTKAKADEIDMENGLEPLEIAEDDWEESPTTRDVPESSTSSPSTSLGNKLRNEFLERQQTTAYKRMSNDRKKLPIHAYGQEILHSIRQNPVTILQAETGRFVFRRVPF